jgi:Bcr/CflA subfamily drug resistance transporter
MKIKNTSFYFIFLIFLAYAAHIPCDGYLPCLLAIKKSFSVDPAAAQVSMSLFLFGTSLSQLIGGGLSDLYGRKNILLIGFIFYLLGSGICFLSPGISIFLLGRLMQGLGIGVSGALRFSILRDLFSDTYFSRAISIINIFTTGVLPFFPLLIGFISYNFGWRYVFLFMVLTAILLILFTIFLPETFKINSKKDGLVTYIQNYAQLVKNPSFLINATSNGLLKASYFICLLANTFFFQTVFKWSSLKFVSLLSFQLVTLTLGSIISAFFVTKYGVKKLIFIGIVIMGTGGVTLFIVGLHNLYNPFYILGAQFCITIGSRIQYANVLTSALDPFPKISGAASALFHSVEMILAALLSSLLTLIDVSSLLSWSILLFFIYIVRIFLYLYDDRLNNKIKQV